MTIYLKHKQIASPFNLAVAQTELLIQIFRLKFLLRPIKENKIMKTPN